MSTMEQNDLQREIQTKLQEMPPADWVQQMIDHYRRTGTYRAKDLRRLLGDPNKGVEIGPNTSIASFWITSNDR